MKSRDEVLTKVRVALEKLMRNQAGQVSPDKKLISDYGLESIDMVDFLFEIERTVGVSINLSEAFALKRKAKGQGHQFDLTLNEITDYLMTIL